MISLQNQQSGDMCVSRAPRDRRTGRLGSFGREHKPSALDAGADGIQLCDLFLEILVTPPGKCSYRGLGFGQGFLDEIELGGGEGLDNKFTRH